MDNKVKDQKIFIKLSSLVALQKRMNRAREAVNFKVQNNATEKQIEASKARLTAFEEVFATLELPL